MGGMAWFLIEDTDGYLAAVSDFLTGFLPPQGRHERGPAHRGRQAPRPARPYLRQHGPRQHSPRQHSLPGAETGCGAEAGYGAETGCATVNGWAAVMADGT
jgi:hypothetical protein